MPQLFQVLRCYKCLVFQVHQTKKSNKWQCKLCGEKQSVKRHYGLGTGKECRLHVQKLNGIRGEIDEENESLRLRTSHIEDIEYESQDSSSAIIDINNYTEVPKENSKWKNFIEDKEQVCVPEVNESMYLGNTEVVLEMPSKKRKKFNVPKAVESTHNSYDNKLNKNKKQSKLNNTTLHNFRSPTNSIKPITESNTETLLPKLTQKENDCQLRNLNNHQSLIKTNISKPNITESKQVFVPAKVNKNSKWAQFAEEPDENIENVSISGRISPENIYGNEFLICKEYLSDNKELGKDNPSKIQKEPQINLNNPFSMCDETDLDDILDF